jgi:hypothetical protein
MICDLGDLGWNVNSKEAEKKMNSTKIMNIGEKVV